MSSQRREEVCFFRLCDRLVVALDRVAARTVVGGLGAGVPVTGGAC